jgi:two-component system phosphate regulon sensor histidine kinase PhoR
VLSSLRNRLLALFLVLVVVVGATTLYVIERTLASDLLTALDARLSAQGRAVADWLGSSGDPRRLATRLAAVTSTRITIIGADGLVQGDSLEPSTIGSPIGEAGEVEYARRGVVGHAVRELRADEPRQYLVAVPDSFGRVIRLAVPLGDIIDTRARMRNRLLVGFGIGFMGALLLSWIFVRAITRPIQSLTLTAERLATGEYDTAPPHYATAAGGELAVLARAMMYMAAEVKARVGELRRERDLLSVVFAGLVEGVIVVEQGGAIALANAAAQPLLRAGEAGGSGASDELPAELVELVERAKYGGLADAEVELNGRTVRASARPLETAGVIIVLYDVTRIRSLEAVRREFLSNAAHELRTPVTSISGYAETLLGAGGAVDAETSREFLQTIHRNAQRITSLVSDLVLLDQLGGRDAAVIMRKPVPLAQVVDDAARTTKGIAPEAQIDVDVSTDLTVLGTREGLDHVVQNLVDNAVKYGGGTPVQIKAARSAAHIRLSISDAGPGIPRGFEERVFERFYRVDSGRSRAQGGSGLGLAIVKSQLEAMGGRVWLEHAEPGARFVIELDAA